MLRVFVCSPLRPIAPDWLIAKFPPGDWQYERWWHDTYNKHLQMARGYCKLAVDAGLRPYAPHLFFTQFLDEKIEADRAAGIAMGTEELLDCDILWFWDQPTSGMRHEIKAAFEAGIPVIYKGAEKQMVVNFVEDGKHLEKGLLRLVCTPDTYHLPMALYSAAEPSERG